LNSIISADEKEKKEEDAMSEGAEDSSITSYDRLQSTFRMINESSISSSNAGLVYEHISDYGIGALSEQEDVSSEPSSSWSSLHYQSSSSVDEYIDGEEISDEEEYDEA
jgi:hypothetical protein